MRSAVSPADDGKKGTLFLLALAAVMILAGTAIAAGGAILVYLGGSAYFLCAGLTLVVAGLLIARRKPLGAWLYAALLVGTVAWSLLDAGLEFWPTFSRVYAPLILGIVVAGCYPLMDPRRGARRCAIFIGMLCLTGTGLLTALAFRPHGAVYGKATLAPEGGRDTQAANWPHWGKAEGGGRYSEASTINRSNVARLKTAWIFRTGVVPPVSWDAQDQNTPLQVGDYLYVCTVESIVIAVQVDDGREAWRFDPRLKTSGRKRCRGLAYFQADEAPSGASCRGRLLVPTSDGRLIAVDALSGAPCREFGRNGTVDLTQGMGPTYRGAYHQTSAPLIAGDLVVVGGRVAGEGSRDKPGGVVRAWSARTGKLEWAFDPGNPEVTKEPPAGSTYTRGSPNAWSAMSYDSKTGTIFVPTANAQPDYWGGDRTPQDDRFSSAVVALDASSGRVRWVFQTVHHDIWDYDVPSQPTLVDLPGNIPAVAITTKQGEVFLLDRRTGRPIKPVREVAVRSGSLPDERYAPTQPVSVGLPSIGSTRLHESDMWGVTPFDSLYCRIKFRKLRYNGRFEPPGLDQSLQFPGAYGGMNWGSASFEPATSTLFVTDLRLGSINRLERHARRTGPGQDQDPPYHRGRRRFTSPLEVPCQKPPYGTISAIDLKSGALKWQIPAGTTESRGPWNLRMTLKLPVGLPTIGPSLVTGGGLLFFAGTQDNYIRAYDTSTGHELWKAALPVGSQGGPITFRSRRTGRQYIAVTAGGAARSDQRGDYLIAFALPD